VSGSAGTNAAALVAGLVGALSSHGHSSEETSAAEQAAVAQAAALSESEWCALLAEPALAARLDAAALAELLCCTCSRALAGVLSAHADYFAADASRAAALDALPRALRASPAPLPHATGARLASELLRKGHLGAGRRLAAAGDAAAAATFREAVAELNLRARAGEAGVELETCLAEAFFALDENCACY
jgi:hypothetical protein